MRDEGSKPIFQHDTDYRRQEPGGHKNRRQPFDAPQFSEFCDALNGASMSDGTRKYWTDFYEFMCEVAEELTTP